MKLQSHHRIRFSWRLVVCLGFALVQGGCSDLMDLWECHPWCSPSNGCGDDGCGGSCGECTLGLECVQSHDVSCGFLEFSLFARPPYGICVDVKEECRWACESMSCGETYDCGTGILCNCGSCEPGAICNWDSVCVFDRDGLSVLPADACTKVCESASTASPPECGLVEHGGYYWCDCDSCPAPLTCLGDARQHDRVCCEMDAATGRCSLSAKQCPGECQPGMCGFVESSFDDVSCNCGECPAGTTCREHQCCTADEPSGLCLLDNGSDACEALCLERCGTAKLTHSSVLGCECGACSDGDTCLAHRCCRMDPESGFCLLDRQSEECRKRCGSLCDIPPLPVSFPVACDCSCAAGAVCKDQICCTPDEMTNTCVVGTDFQACNASCFNKCGTIPIPLLEEGLVCDCGLDCPDGDVCHHNECCTPKCSLGDCGTRDDCGGTCPSCAECTSHEQCQNGMLCMYKSDQGALYICGACGDASPCHCIAPDWPQAYACSEDAECSEVFPCLSSPCRTCVNGWCTLATGTTSASSCF